MSRPTPGRLRLPRVPTVLEDALPGGLRVLAVRRSAVPLVQVRLAFAVAGSHISKSAGPSVLAESMLAGTDRRDRSELARAVQRLGGHLGASCREDSFVLSASVLAENLRELLELLVEVLTGASYPLEEVRADRERLANETLIALSQPDVVAGEALRRRLYARHPYAAGLPRPASLQRVSVATLQSLHREILDPAAGQLLLLGDLEPRRGISMARDVLAPWLATSKAPASLLPPLPAIAPGPIEIVPRDSSVQSNVRLGGPAPRRSDPQWPATVLANLIFGGLFASRLVENLRERHGYTYSPRSAVRHGRAGSSLVIEADVATKATAAALLETSYELGRIALGGVTEAELEAARRYAIGSFTFMTATQSGLAETLSALSLAGLPPGYLKSHPAAIAKAKRAEVEAAARCYLAPTALVTVVVGDPAAIASQLSSLGAVTVSTRPSTH
ncbi:MAG: M16 family metallopeptidase [Acidimicrobiales bacterium]